MLAVQIFVLLFTLMEARGIPWDQTISYCARRRPQTCCPGRDDECTMPIRRGSSSSLCYCDEFCYKHSVEDCCPDYEPVCQGRQTGCNKNGRSYSVGERVREGCNECVCTSNTGSSQGGDGWQCSNDACINDDELVSRINKQSYGWTAGTYSQFNGASLIDGVNKYFLGTKMPARDVLNLNPMNMDKAVEHITRFDAREKWAGLIQPPMDQERCASSWAFSTASVASDRWAIQMNGSEIILPSVQQIMDCLPTSALPCRAGPVEDAWWMLMKRGAVQDSCYPYTSGQTGQRGYCQLPDMMSSCPNGLMPYVLQTTPAYRIDADESHIKMEIFKNGPVQAIIEVRADLFLYQTGIYSYTRQPEFLSYSGRDHTIVGTHSVKIVGWGEENGVRYWLVANSWGRDWGEKGYFRIRRGVDESGIESFVVGVWPEVQKHMLKEGWRLHHAHRHKSSV